MPILPLRLEHASALADFLADFERAGESEIPAYFPARDWSHERVVTSLSAWSRGEELEGSQVPCTTLFWFANHEIVGVVNLRHELNESLETYGGHVGYSVRPSARGRGYGTRLLSSALELARKLGLERVLVTCAPDNIGSIRVIERNQGVLQGVHWHEPMQRWVRMHWIDLSSGRA